MRLGVDRRQLDAVPGAESMPLIVLLALPLAGCFVAGVISRVVAAPELSPTVVRHSAWAHNVIDLNRVRRCREVGGELNRRW